VGAFDPVVSALVAAAAALIAVDLCWAQFSKWTMDHPAVTAVVTGVLVGLIAGLFLDRRARQREQSKYQFLRLEAMKALCAAVRELTSALPSDERDGKEIDLAENALRTFKRELSSWQGALLEIDEARFLRHCYECAEHFSTALRMMRHPESHSWSLSPARGMVEDDSDYFASEEKRISVEEVRRAEVAIYHAMQQLKSSEASWRTRPSAGPSRFGRT
jgi:hypothetical protein